MGQVWVLAAALVSSAAARTVGSGTAFPSALASAPHPASQDAQALQREPAHIDELVLEPQALPLWNPGPLAHSGEGRHGPGGRLKY